MPVLEDFVTDLLKANIIENYKADVEKVRNFYNEHYKNSTKFSFHNFTLELWKTWYVLHWTKKELIFDTKWTDYFKKLEEDRSSGRKYITQAKCLMCDIAFNEDNINHSETDDHKIRLQYLTNKNAFKDTNEVVLEITEMSNNIRPTSLKIEYPVQTDLNATLSIKNNTKKQVNVMGIVVINSLIKEVILTEEFDRGILLTKKNTVDVHIHGFFANSAAFIYPIIIITEVKGSNVRNFHLKELQFDITSEFSSLKPNSNYIKSKADAFETFKEQLDTIIPGEKPSILETYEYKETLALKQYKIPNDFNKNLLEVIKNCPKINTQDTNTFYSSFFNIYPGFTPSNYFTNLERLLHIEENQTAIDMRDYDLVSTVEQIKGSALFYLKVPGLAEDRPSILVFDRIYLKGTKSERLKYEGYVHHVLEQGINIGLNRRFYEIFIPNKKFHIEFGFNRRTIRVEKQALDLANQHGIIPLLFPSRAEILLKPFDNWSINFSNRDLNEEQKLAVQNIVLPKMYPFVIFGPPGTGKTVTVVEAAYQIYKNYPNSKILITAPSNAAANEVAFRLVKIIPKSDLFRLLGSVYSKLIEDGSNTLKDVMNIQRDGVFYMPSVEELLTRRILITTIVTAARLVNGGATGHFTHVFIDESGYATETQTLIPIAGILSSLDTPGKLTGQIILAGDPKQLGPRVHSSFSKHCGYGTSMLERLIKSCEMYAEESRDDRCVTKLVNNYRSHETILKVPSDLFYHGKLKAVGNEFTNAFLGWEHLKNKKFPIIFHHVEGEDVREENSPSFFNVQEIEVVVEYLQTLLSTKVKGMKITQGHIGVITPYRKQAEKLRAACSKRKWNNLLVGSVEQFQGKERMIMIISTVRSKNVHKFESIDQKCQLGFLRNPKRFNVALTRAKALLIVIGNANVLKTDTSWLRFIQYCLENNSVAGKRFDFSDN